MKLYAGDFSAGSATGGIQEAHNALPRFGRLIVDQPAAPTVGVTLSKSLELDLQAPITWPAGNSLVGFVLTAMCEVNGRGQESLLSGSGASAFMMENGADSSRFNQVALAKYNQMNINGHGGFVAYGPVAPIAGLRFYDCETSNGNGNGFRLGRVVDCDAIGNAILSTTGQSAEAVTLAGRNIRFIRNRIDRAYETGVLIYGDPGFSYENIILAENIISNCSQDPLWPGDHSAFELCSMEGTITGVIVSKNVCYDDQAKTTTQSLLDVDTTNGGQPGAGTISNVKVPADNVQWGCARPAQIVYNVPSQAALVNWVVG